jgi:predicted phosphodiesterase
MIAVRIALIADVHANEAALDAVMDAIRLLLPDCVVCLGDVVGYNAEPRQCIRKVRDFADVVVAGNHDVEAFSETHAAGTTKPASISAQWTREQLTDEDRQYLASLPSIHENANARFVAVHGCYLNDTHVNGYVTGTMLEENLRMIARVWAPGTVASCGHTHVPISGWIAAGETTEAATREVVRWPDRADAVLVNPGSVGQPRDGDARASFGILDTSEKTFECIRVAYDIERTASAVLRAGLPPVLAERLKEGR